MSAFNLGPNPWYPDRPDLAATGNAMFGQVLAAQPILFGARPESAYPVPLNFGGPLEAPVNMFLGGALQNAQMNAGFLPSQLFPTQNYYDYARSVNYWDQRRQAMAGAWPGDRERIYTGTEGILRSMFGAELPPELMQGLGQTLDFAGPFAAQQAAMMFPGQFGDLATAGVIGFHSGGRYAIDPVTGQQGLSGASAAALADSVARIRAGDSSRFAGLTTYQVGELYGAAQAYLPPSLGLLDAEARFAAVADSPAASQRVMDAARGEAASLTLQSLRAAGLDRVDALAGPAEVLVSSLPVERQRTAMRDAVLDSARGGGLEDLLPRIREFISPEDRRRLAQRYALGDESLGPETLRAALSADPAATGLSADLARSTARDLAWDLVNTSGVATRPEGRALTDRLAVPGQADGRLEGLSLAQFQEWMSDPTRRAGVLQTLEQTAPETYRQLRDSGGLAALDRAPATPETLRAIQAAMPEAFGSGELEAQAERVRPGLERMSRVVRVMRDIFGGSGQDPNAPIQQILQSLDSITQGGLGTMAPEDLERKLLTFQSTARVTGMDYNSLNALTMRSAAMLSASGADPRLALGITTDAAAFGMAYGQTGAMATPNWFTQDQERVTMLDQQLRTGAAASPQANARAAVLRLRDDLQAAGRRVTGPLAAAAEAIESGQAGFTFGGRSYEFSRLEMADFERLATGGGAARGQFQEYYEQSAMNQEVIEREGLADDVRSQVQGVELANQLGQRLGSTRALQRALGRHGQSDRGGQVAANVLRGAMAEIPPDRVNDRNYVLGYMAQALRRQVPGMAQSEAITAAQGMYAETQQIIADDRRRPLADQTLAGYGSLEGILATQSRGMIAQQGRVRDAIELETTQRELLLDVGRDGLIQRALSASGADGTAAPGGAAWLSEVLGGVEAQTLQERIGRVGQMSDEEVRRRFQVEPGAEAAFRGQLAQELESRLVQGLAAQKGVSPAMARQQLQEADRARLAQRADLEQRLRQGETIGEQEQKQIAADYGMDFEELRRRVRDGENVGEILKRPPAPMEPGVAAAAAVGGTARGEGGRFDRPIQIQGRVSLDPSFQELTLDLIEDRGGTNVTS